MMMIKQAQSLPLKELLIAILKMLFLLLALYVAACHAVPAVLLQRLQAPNIGCSYKVASQKEQDWSEQYSVCVWTEFSPEGADADGTATVSSSKCSSDRTGTLALPDSLPGYYVFNAAVVMQSDVVDSESLVSRISRLVVPGAGTQHGLSQSLFDFTTALPSNHGASCTDLYEEALSRWERRYIIRKQFVDTLKLTDQPPRYMLDPWEPEWDCSVQDRVGEHEYNTLS
jgi:hypothetical protein